MTHSILIVDDEPSMRSLLDIMLTRAGYTTHQAENAEQALEFIGMTVPDVFLLDVMMPGMSGTELCSALRAKPETAQHPIILLSARTDQNSKLDGLASGANLYLTKPIGSKELTARIEEVLSQSA